MFWLVKVCSFPFFPPSLSVKENYELEVIVVCPHLHGSIEACADHSLLVVLPVGGHHPSLVAGEALDQQVVSGAPDLHLSVEGGGEQQLT